MPAAKAECRPVRCGRTCSCGRRLSVLSRMIAPRSFKSRYSFVVSYARNTACTVVNMRGLHHAHARAVSHGRQAAPYRRGRRRGVLPVPHEVREDELEPAAVVLREDVQRLRVAAQAALRGLDVQAHDAVVPDTCRWHVTQKRPQRAGLRSDLRDTRPPEWR